MPTFKKYHSRQVVFRHKINLTSDVQQTYHSPLQDVIHHH